MRALQPTVPVREDAPKQKHLCYNVLVGFKVLLEITFETVVLIYPMMLATYTIDKMIITENTKSNKIARSTNAPNARLQPVVREYD